MRPLSLGAALVLCGAFTGCGKSEPALSREPAPPGTLLRYHCVGTAQLAEQHGEATLSKLLALPETAGLAEQNLQRLAAGTHLLLRPRTSPSTSDFAALLKPLYADLLREESYLEVRGPTAPAPEIVLAVKLNEARAHAWSTNLSAVVQNWTQVTPVQAPVEGFAAWTVRLRQSPLSFRLARAGDWVVLGLGPNNLAFQQEVLKRIKAQKRPLPAAADHWLSLTLDTKQMAPWIALPPRYDAGKVELLAYFAEENVRIKGTFTHAAPLNLQLDPWRPPTNLVTDPIVSFAAVRGLGSWVSRQPELQPYKWDPMPNQYFLWALSRTPFNTYLAAPTTQPTNRLGAVAAKLLPAVQPELTARRMGSLLWETNANSLFWKDLAFVMPFLRATRDGGTDYILGGLYPPVARTNPAPATLFEQLGSEPNVVYYDWEITQARLQSTRNLRSLYGVITSQGQLKKDAAATKWLDAIAPQLGNTATRVMLTAPNQLSFVRKGHIGLTAAELLLVSTWFESLEFPRFGLTLPLPPKVRSKGTNPPPAAAKPTTVSQPAPAATKPAPRK